MQHAACSDWDLRSSQPALRGRCCRQVCLVKIAPIPAHLFGLGVRGFQHPQQPAEIVECILQDRQAVEQVAYRL